MDFTLNLFLRNLKDMKTIDSSTFLVHVLFIMLCKNLDDSNFLSFLKIKLF